jgi:hypothetical protein
MLQYKMTISHHNVLSRYEITSLLNHPSVQQAKEKLNHQNMVYFSLPLSSSIKSKLQETFGLNMDSLDSIPMRWIKGDTFPHIDKGAHSFENTYLMYLTNSTGSLVVDGESYPIQEGSAYVFEEGLEHKTINTGIEPRLLIGPMSNQGFAVGLTITITYFSNKADADSVNFPSNIAYSNGSYVVGNIDSGSIGSYTKWKISSSSTGTSSQSVVYNNGDTLNFVGTYNLYPYTVKKPINQRQTFNQSLKIGSVWKAFVYYETRALKYGFTRFRFPIYRRIYYQNR